MDLISKYANELTADDPLPSTEEPSIGAPNVPGSSSSLSSITAALIALLVSLTAGFIGWGEISITNILKIIF